MQMNYKVAGQFEKLYPVTLGDNVKMNCGQTLEQWKQEVADLLNTIENSYTDIWTGNDVMGVTYVGITMPSTLASAKNGWILVWGPVSSDSNNNYCYVPKVHNNGQGIKFIVGGTGGVVYSKFVAINGTQITGHNINNQNGNENMALKRVIAY